MRLDISRYQPFGLEPIETASRDEISALQTWRLKQTLEHAYQNVAAYRTKFDAAGVSAADFKSLEDLAKFPFTSKKDLRATILSVCSRYHVRSSCGFTPPLAPQASQLSSAIPARTLTPGQILSPARCGRVAHDPVCLFISRLATVSLPEGSECTMAPNGSDVASYPWLAA